MGAPWRVDYSILNARTVVARSRHNRLWFDPLSPDASRCKKQDKKLKTKRFFASAWIAGLTRYRVAERGLIRTEERPRRNLDKGTGLGDRIIEIGGPDQALGDSYANSLRRAEDRIGAVVRREAPVQRKRVAARSRLSIRCAANQRRGAHV
jgi:hypothetical protein